MKSNYAALATEAMLVCALWSSTDEDGEPLEGGTLDIHATATASLAADLADFLAANAADLADLDPMQVGHDFWLTRNHHGAGFWDRGLGEAGDRLTAACHPYGEVWLYVGDDGWIYAA